MANNSAVASMGYGLPAAIGTCIGGGRRETICLEGDGSIMMNLQELQTILTNKLPIKIFLINNSGYHSIRITQTNLFNKNFVGIGPESGDLSFPEYRKIAEAFGYRYYSAHSNEEMKKTVTEVLTIEGPVFTEIFTDIVVVINLTKETDALRVTPMGRCQMLTLSNLTHLFLHHVADRKESFLQLPVVYLGEKVRLILHGVRTGAEPF